MMHQTINLDRSVVVVTGAAGFIGGALCDHLLRNENLAEVIGIDNISEYYSTEIKRARLKKLKKYKNFQFFELSVTNKGGVEKILHKHSPSFVIHTAAEVGVRNGEKYPLKYYDTNVTGTASLLYSLPKNVKHVVIMSSSSVYGSERKVPFVETSSIDFRKPLSVYAASKAAMEYAAYKYHASSGTPLSVVRPFSVYGPDGRPDMLPMKLLIKAAKGEEVEIYAPEENYRDWTYIDDLVLGVISVLQMPFEFEVVNIGSGKPQKLGDTVELIRKVLEKHNVSLQTKIKPANNNEIRVTHANIEKLSTIYGVRMNTEFKDGFGATAEYFFRQKQKYL